MSQHTPGPCACTYEACANHIHGTGISIPVGRIMYCPLHVAAPEMYTALRKLTNELSEIQVSAVREGAGNSNANALQLRTDEARTLLAQIDGGGQPSLPEP